MSKILIDGGKPLSGNVTIGGAKNAGLLAARILGAGQGTEAEALRSRLDDYRGQLRQVALDKGRALQE